MKFVPVTVSVNAMPPAVASVGVTEVIVGVAGGVGEITKIYGRRRTASPARNRHSAMPAFATSVAVIWACRALALTNVVVRELPFQSTVEPEE